MARAVCLQVVANAELLDEVAVLEDVAVLDVNQQTTTLTDDLKQATTGVVILRVLLEVLGEIADALGEDRNLDLCAAGIVGTLAELGDQLCSAFFGDAVLVSHRATFLLGFLRAEHASGGACRLRAERYVAFCNLNSIPDAPCDCEQVFPLVQKP